MVMAASEAPSHVAISLLSGEALEREGLNREDGEPCGTSGPIFERFSGGIFYVGWKETGVFDETVLLNGGLRGVKNG